MVDLSAEVTESLERNALVNAAKHSGKADVGAVMSKVLGEFPEMRTRASDLAGEAKKVVTKVNAMDREAQAKLLGSKYPGFDQEKEKEGRVGLPPLPSAQKGKVVVRLPPEPSGFMHLGHAMSFTINYEYRMTYGGVLWLRFEDTNPRKVSKRYYDSFRRGIKWLGIEWDKERIVSEDNELVYDYGRRMLESGAAYTCSCDPEKVKRLRAEGKECEHRARGADENLKVWRGMLERKYKEGQAVVRLKGDMASLDLSLRDPNLFRVIDHEHPVTGTRYVVWPTYYLANAVEDEACGVTHILRSAEFNNNLQQWIRDALGLGKPVVVQYSRYNFKGTPVGKRLLRPLVEAGLVSGWDDPRMPTIAGVERRGIIPESVRQFTLQVGYTKSEHEFDWSLLFAVNRKLLDPVSRRVFFVPDPVPLDVDGAPRRTVSLRFHPSAELGERTIETGHRFYVPGADLKSVKPGEVFRLMDLYNLELVEGGPLPKARFAGDDLVQDTRKLQWTTERNHDVKVLAPGVLFGEDGRFNEASLAETKGVAEEAFATVLEGEVVQFPRFGFCRLDSPGVMILAHK